MQEGHIELAGQEVGMGVTNMGVVKRCGQITIAILCDAASILLQIYAEA